MPSNLIIRAARPEDAPGICAIQAMPGFRSGTLRLPFPSAEAIGKWLQGAGEGRTILVGECNGEIVANANFSREAGRRNHVGSVAMGVHDNYVGKGIGTAMLTAMIDLADNWLDLRRLELTVFTDNAPAVRLYQKFGFEQEGLIRDFAFRDGRYADAFAMARLKRPA